MKKIGPLFFEPKYVNVIWGGERIKSFKGVDDDMSPFVGESRELCEMSVCRSASNREDEGKTLRDLIKKYQQRLVGSRVVARGGQFPVVLKLLDAKCDLSVQVHPDNDMACQLYGSCGKNELWYVIEATEGSKVGIGFKDTYSREEIRLMMETGRIVDAIQYYDSKPGDIFDLPAGTIHVLGAGNLVAEVQQPCDVTFRIWDYNREGANGEMRELHQDLAIQALRFATTKNSLTEMELNARFDMANSVNNYAIRVDDVDGSVSIINDETDVCHVIMCLFGEIEIEVDGCCHAVSQGMTMLIPAESMIVNIRGKKSKYLTIAI